jgi:transposase
MAADGVSQHEIARRLGINRRTVKRMLESDEPPAYRRAAQGSKVDRFEPVIRATLEEGPDIKAPPGGACRPAHRLPARPGAAARLA